MRILLSLLALTAFIAGNAIAEHHEEAAMEEHETEVSSTMVTGHDGSEHEEHAEEHGEDHHEEGEKH